MLLPEQSPSVYPDHFDVHADLGGGDREDWNINCEPEEEVIKWASEITDELDDDHSVYPSNLRHMHFTFERLGLANDIPEKIITDYLVPVCQQEFANQRSFDAVLLPPKAGDDAITAEFDSNAQILLADIQTRLIKCSSFVLGDTFVLPEWFKNRTVAPKKHLSLEYLTTHTLADKIRLQNKIDRKNPGSIKNRITGFDFVFQTSRPYEGFYEQKSIAKIKFRDAL